MQVRVVQHFLIPGVEYSEKTDVCTETARIGGNGEQRFGNRAEQDAVKHAWILERKKRKLLRKGEDDMAVGNGQQFGRSCCQPPVAGRGLALWTMAIAARVVGDDLTGAAIALLDVSAEGGGSACADVSECPALLGIEHMPPLPEEFLFVLTKDIGDFEPMFAHRCRASSLERSIGLSWRASNGLGVA